MNTQEQDALSAERLYRAESLGECPAAEELEAFFIWTEENFTGLPVGFLAWGMTGVKNYEQLLADRYPKEAGATWSVKPPALAK